MIQDQVVDVIVDILGVDKESVKPESHILDDLGADSLTVMELMLELEKHFDLEISDAEAKELSTVQSITDYIAARINI